MKSYFGGGVPLRCSHGNRIRYIPLPADLETASLRGPCLLATGLSNHSPSHLSARPYLQREQSPRPAPAGRHDLSNRHARRPPVGGACNFRHGDWGSSLFNEQLSETGGAENGCCGAGWKRELRSPGLAIGQLLFDG
ncbi:hypothetical protein chiPu_0003490 [Chiloscyllium punctatum]|uniref:Uncharacterized protein n=1 Tax=Chiloscyllium punctatum TaxID=137246 RepID=A0A401S3U5_CHIPU|nr:hypothetical protein [Chiloscyllium punctatum]